MSARPVHAPPWLALLALSVCSTAQGAKPVVAIIIDDLGYRHAEGLRAVRLPAPVACAVIPDSPYAVTMAETAHRRGKEVLVHLPMQPLDPQRPVGEHGITMATTRLGMRQVVHHGLAGVPHATGVNNHMGSLITRHPGHMTWLMQELRSRELFFVDSMTTGASVALSMAREQGVPAAARDIFLDREDMSEQDIAARLDRLFELARRRGYALGIAHPYPATIALLERRLRSADDGDVRLVTVAELIAVQGRAGASATINIANQSP